MSYTLVNTLNKVSSNQADVSALLSNEVYTTLTPQTKGNHMCKYLISPWPVMLKILPTYRLEYIMLLKLPIILSSNSFYFNQLFPV